jgi:hypothetical protein
MLVGLLASAAPAETSRHSGTVLEADPARGALVLAEVGPWRVEKGATVVTRREIRVTASTEFARVRRAPEGTTTYAGDFVEAPVHPWDLRVGDFVTVQCRRDDSRLTALKVMVTEVAAP